MLTEKQHELLKYIYQRVTENGISPSYDEMKLAVNLHSKSGIHRLVNALEERGYIRRLPNRARALEIIKHPFANQSNELAKKIEIEKTQSFTNENRKSSFVEVPIMGRIAAGSPIAAIQEKN